MQLYSKIIKPLLDSTIALVGLIVLSPLLVVLTIFLYWANDGKPFFLQPRPGRNGKVFRVVKFKTMNDKRAADGQLLPDEARLTPVGKFIRKTSLDELPQLLNVLKGDMSLVGPRPLLVEYLPLYNDLQWKRHNVKPGITGWAQVNGRNAVSWSERFAYDAYYVDNISFALDVKILRMTVLKVIQSEGISSASSVSMEKFTGNDPR
ncbi:sugar transferase [Chitinophaga ginsengisoli]|uniref:Lipopolysaccharide/colanic/teichoic acid biosynthesis glycosyltransferase n=1 Tax=Chitinophaga ginsengisoli TaxID=363837 RepID=A0A2P8GKX4_9BACT|nr:sugar transferase [Chitinophaga ginsengisoli]PSL34619.1 lipopolysaccharide/colanic/teichoic acid biosynthesis glycosyltransferase [Chitinophaga ginsengisoli]